MRFVFVILLAVFFAGCIQSTQTGRSQLMLMSESQEKQLGEQSAQEILKESKLSTDKVATAQVLRVGKKIAAAADKNDYNWEFFLIIDESKNAFCLPGGKVFVHTGIMSIIASDDELATVMGHEVAHALLRHGAERSSINTAQSVAGAVLTGIVSIFAPNYANATQIAYNLGSNYAVALPYSRSHELEADKVGVMLMIKAGYDPKAAISFWQKMNGSGKGTDFFSTHPSDEKRISQIQEIIKEENK